MTEDEKNKLGQYRRSIDNLDAALIYLVAERFRLTQQVGEYKRANKLPPADEGREAELIARLRQLAVDSELDPDFAERLIRFIIDEVVRNHERIRDS